MLSRRSFTEIPPELLQDDSLTSLNLAQNNIEQLPDHLQWPHLKVLMLGDDCGGNLLTRLPESICSLASLVELDLSHNKLSYLPQQISLLHNLQILRVKGNRLKELPSLSGLQRLSLLDVSHNQLQVLPESLTLLESLRVLDVSYNKLRYLSLRQAKYLQKISVIICGNPLSCLQVDEYAHQVPSLKLLALQALQESGQLTELLQAFRLEMASCGLCQKVIVQGCYKPKQSIMLMGHPQVSVQVPVCSQSCQEQCQDRIQSLLNW